ncbi:MATE family efflux transporter [Victivallis sp. Marseille-Q1083]|uniref:MATE family efflux transporter n=1 Tax=Victivallis sp. Marseille-Q1083 TaxID=2717288 RepID=UPI00158DEE4F|nr:MATE family efflux transporter [Victivallis sp. Marseille-Q1083]
MKEFAQNLTVGKVSKQLFRFTVPLFFANLLQAFYNITDMIVVGRFVGSTGLAAVSNASVLCFIIAGIGQGITIGGTVLVARTRGAGDRRGERETIGTLFTLTALAALPVTVAGLMLSRQIFVWLELPDEALPEAVAYMDILSGGTIAIFGYNAVCALLRGRGDSRRPLQFVAVAAVVNVVLDLLLVGWLQLGTSGAAWATVTAQGVALSVALGHLKQREFFCGFRLRSLVMRPDKVAGILQTGIPSALQMLVVNLAFLLVTGMFNRYGVAVAAAAGIGLKISTLAGMPCWAVGQAVTAMAAQNLGANQIARTAETALAGIRLSLLSTGTAVVLIQLFAAQVIGCFNSDPEVIRTGVVYLRIFCSFSGLAYAVMYTCDAFATGTGAASLALFNALLEAVLLRLLLCWLFGMVWGGGFVGVCWGMALSTLPPALIGLGYYRRGSWRRLS